LLFLDVTGLLLHDRRYDWGPRTWTQAEVRQKVGAGAAYKGEEGAEAGVGDQARA
jgi:hypothetical protein